MARKADLSLAVVIVLVIYHTAISEGAQQIRHHDKRAMGSMFQDILKSIKTNFVPGSKSKNQKGGGGDGGDSTSGGSSSGSWKNMIPDIAKAFIPDEDKDNSTSTEDIQDKDSASNITEVDPQATEINAGVLENMPQDTKTNTEPMEDSGKKDDDSQDGEKEGDSKTEDPDKVQNDDKHDEISIDTPVESDRKQEKVTEKQNEKVNEGITENMNNDNVDKAVTKGTPAGDVTTEPANQVQSVVSKENGDHDETAPLSWEAESAETGDGHEDTDNGSEKQTELDDQTVNEDGSIKVNAGVTENQGNDNVNPGQGDKSSPPQAQHVKETPSIVEKLTYEKSQPLSWEIESPEVPEKTEKQTRR
ncbi:clumping factor A-like [Argopecten irradians]|uniref:clumping factor A-like n=1 Tax=Argopecten irradians TaxID=31199 RepID=UPI00371E5D12